MTRRHAAWWFSVAALLMAVALTAAAQQRAGAEKQLEAAIHREQVLGDVKGAIEQYKKIVALPGGNRTVAAQALIHLGRCYEKLGEAQVKEARATYERVVREFGDQAEPTKLARARLSALAGAAGGITGRTEVATRRIWVAGQNAPVGISPDGRYAVYVPPDSGDLWLRDLQSGEQRRITREASGAAMGDALISPDGKQIAYDWRVGGCDEVHVSALDGSSMRVIRPCQEPGEYMIVGAWMPDGHRILATSYDPRDGASRRHVVSLPEGTVRNIGQPVRESGLQSRQYLDWGHPSPDGRHIAYGLKGDISIYDTATEQDSVLVQNPAADDVVGWTPDGSGIVFVSDRSGTRDLYLLGIDNGRPRGDPQTLRRNFGANTDLHLSRDGRLFRVEDAGAYDSFIVPVDEQSGRLTGSPSPVDRNSYPEVRWPAWSPDGKLLYYLIYKGPRPRTQSLSIRTEATGQRREVTPNPRLSNWHGPILSPDGRRFAVSGTGQNRNFGLFAIDSESGEVSQLAKIPTDNHPVEPFQNWSADGNAIFYTVRSLEKSEGFVIRRKDLTTGEERDVHRGFRAIDMKISPDATRFVYVRTDPPTKSHVLGILDIQSGKELELWRVPEAEPASIGTPAWTPDGRHVLVGRDLKQGSELWRFPAAGGPGDKLHFFKEWTWGFVMHASGQRMAFTQSRKSLELWVMENFLPAAKSPAK